MQMAAHLATFPDQSGGQPLPPTPRKSTRKAHAPRCDVRTPLSRMAGVDLTALEGIEEETALVILSEIGTDIRRWPSVKHFCSWLGLSPIHKVSGGKVLARRVRPGANRVARALRLAAGSVHHSQSALGAFFRRMQSRLGAPKASTATAHKLARLVYSLVKHGTASVQQGMEEYEAQYRDRKVKGRVRQAKALGSTLVPLAAPDGQSMHAVPGLTPSKQTTRHRRSASRVGERGVYILSREKHTLADAVTLTTTHSLTQKFLGRRSDWDGTGYRPMPSADRQSLLAQSDGLL